MNDYFWKGHGTPTGEILYGVIGEEQAGKPGTYRFSSTDGFVVNDAHILSPDASTSGVGERTKPRPGTPCVALMSSNGAQAFICGFQFAPHVDDESDDPPQVGNPADNESSGDKVYETDGGARLVLKRGGAVFLESGPGVSVFLNPLNNKMSLRSSNMSTVADGYRAIRGRREIGETKPETLHSEEFLDQVGATFDRVTIKSGKIGGGARRQLEMAGVTVIGGTVTASVKNRETYFSDGSWVGEGPKYQWGGAAADEPAVLGNALVDAFNKLFDIIKELKVNTAWGPSTVPIVQTQIDINKLQNELSAKILSTFMFFSKDPAIL